MANPFDKPLTDDEFVEIGELLASIPEPFEPMEPDRMDGFLTALLLLPEEPSPQAWMPWIFDAEGRPEAKLADERDQDRLEELVYRRYRSIDRTICQRKPLDPILYEVSLLISQFGGIAAAIVFLLYFGTRSNPSPSASGKPPTVGRDCSTMRIPLCRARFSASCVISPTISRATFWM